MNAAELTGRDQPEFDSLRNLLLGIASERSLDRLFKTVVEELGRRPHALFAQIWLAEKGDQCAACQMSSECADRCRCLHLAASSAFPQLDQPKRIPLGFGEIGRIGATGEAVVTDNFTGNLTPAWKEPEDVRGFDGQPITYQNQVLGVLAQFTRTSNPAGSPFWLRIFADHIGAAIANARAFDEIEKLRLRLELENTLLQREVEEAKAYGELVGQSAALKQLMRQVEMVARTDATVLILGESGTGKELVAREIHKRSPRRDRPLIRVNCASIPRELYESEFFGHVKGAFTGAVKDRAGRFEAANGGSLFLDEVGEIPHDLQGKFLRVLQEGQYERVGEEKTRTVDVRIIAATNRDLFNDVASGRFRQDLFYRLNVFPLKVAPLRERQDDAVLLAEHFIAWAARKLKLPSARLTPAQRAQIQTYNWPGNVRELQNTIERGLILAQNGVLSLDLPGRPPAAAPSPPPASPAGSDAQPGIWTDLQFRHRERDNLIAALNATRWKIHGPGGTAEMLGLKPTTLISRIKKLGLKRPAELSKTTQPVATQGA